MKVHVVFVLATLGIVHCQLKLSCSDIKKFIDGHNERRLQLARGEVSGQPPASAMNSIVWDEELAEKASLWASRNEYEHNPDVTIPSGRFQIGENLFLYSTTAEDFALDPDLALDAWWAENKDFEFGPVDASDGEPVVGHYTQMAWADSTRLGCGISQYNENGWNNFLVVCDYGPAGNYVGMPPYTEGTPSGSLECGSGNCDKEYGDSC